MYVRHWWTSLFCVALAAATIGCGRSDRSPLGNVTGTVTYQGEPLKQGTIIFETTGSKAATGRIQNGQIVETTTYEAGDGVPVGHHRVAIQSVDTGGSVEVSDPGQTTGSPADYMSGKSLLPSRYGDPSASGLTADIQAGDNQVAFDLTE